MPRRRITMQKVLKSRRTRKRKLKRRKLQKIHRGT
jgi:hypothetical protein